MNINVHIERLIVDGLPVSPDQRPLVQAAMSAELGRLLSARGLGPQVSFGGAMPRVDAGTVRPPSADPSTLGQQIASAVHQGLVQ